MVPAVKEEVVLWLHKNPEESDKLIEKVKNNQRVRKELSAIKKEARERARKVAIRIPKLTDCKLHFDKPRGKRREETFHFAHFAPDRTKSHGSFRAIDSR